jgi:hypothetical protein
MSRIIPEEISGGGGGGGGLVDQGNPAATSDAWPIKVTDGSDVAAVTSSSTAAQATDKGLVVALSPNSPLPDGSNVIGKVQIRNPGDTVDLGDAANPIRIDPTGSTAQPVSDGGSSLTVDGTVTANQGTPNTLANAWTVEVTDGTNTLPTGDDKTRAIYTKSTDGTNDATIKAGSTASIVTDTSLVVALSPNSPLPTGSNSIGTVTAVQATATNLNATVAQGSPNSATNRWPVQVTDGTNFLPTGDAVGRSVFTKISDGTNGPVSVVPASSQASFTDLSLVVQISPNQDPIPTTLVPQTSTPGSSIGRISNLNANTFSPVRQTTYVEQTTNGQRSIVSTSASDTALGTGARTVIITYYDQTCTGPFTETVTLNGLTAVNTVATNICFIERIQVLSVGSNGSNVGTLNLYTGLNATGTIFAAVGVGAIATGLGDNQTLYAHHYVNAGSNIKGYAVTTGIIAAAGGGASVTVLRARNPTDPNSPFLIISDILNAAQGNSLQRIYTTSIEIPGPLVIVAYVTAANNNSIATCSFDWSEE